MAATFSVWTTAAYGELHGGANAEVEALGYAVADCDFLGVGAGPPLPLRDFVAIGRCVGPGEFRILQHAAREMLIFQFVEGFAIQRDEAALHYRA